MQTTQAPKVQILIASYRRDFYWLDFCLASIEKYAKEFCAPPAVIVPREDYDNGSALICARGRATVYPSDGHGFGRAQVAMMQGDLYCPDADYVALWGSDFLALGNFTPQDLYWAQPIGGKPVMYYNTWPHLQKHAKETLFWRQGTEHALGIAKSAGEFMRVPHLIFPKRLYPRVRDHIARHHQTSFDGFVQEAVNDRKNFSESNVLGEYAWHYMHDVYDWRCLDQWEGPWPGTHCPVMQFWSHGGLDRLHDRPDFGYNRVPRETIAEVLQLTPEEVQAVFEKYQ